LTKAIEEDNDCRIAFEKDRYLAGHPVLLHYTIARQEHKGPELHGFPLGFDEEALGVFSTKEMAQSFVLLKALGQEWRVRKFSAGELVSLLMGPYAAIDWVLLDPLPGYPMVGGASPSLMHWESFTEYLLG
jgi:hypothetical protein